MILIAPWVDATAAEYILAFINWRSDHSIENGSDRVNLVARRTDQRFLGTTPHGQSPHFHLTCSHRVLQAPTWRYE